MTVRVVLEPRDMWIGVFWDRSRGFDLYVCLLPCFPIHFAWRRGLNTARPWWDRE